MTGRRLLPGVLLGLLAVAPAAGAAVERPVSKDVMVVLGDDVSLVLKASPRAGEGYLAFAERLTGSIEPAARLKELNADPRPVAGKLYVVPLELVDEPLRLEALRALFPEDGPDDLGWRHVVRRDSVFERTESLWFLAVLFTGDGRQYLELQKSSGLRSTTIHPGDVVRIPRSKLRAPFYFSSAAEQRTRAAAERRTRADAERRTRADSGGGGPAPEKAAPTPPPAPSPTPPAPAVAGPLSYERDEKGLVAVYRLEAGEALYSSVIIRFTGRIHADDVNALVPLIQRRSHIEDLTDIPVGYPVKIPVELLSAEYLPPDDPRRVAYDRSRRESARFKSDTLAPDLDGVYVLLDTGHGGRDLGAMSDAVWEHDYVYDIMCRIKARMESETRARVIPMLKDRKSGYRPIDRKRLSRTSEEYLLTNPNYRLDDAVMGVNLRWYLANSLYRDLVKKGVDRRKIVFVSLHADSLHPDVRGAMVYVPGEEYTGGRHGPLNGKYRRYKEVRSQPSFSFTKRERKEAEGLSRQLASQILGAFRQQELPIHREKPVRESVFRKGRHWLPAVLRSNPVPTRVLLEVVNLNHKDDNRLLELPSFRDKVADGFVDALRAYYGAQDSPRLARKSAGR